MNTPNGITVDIEQAIQVALQKHGAGDLPQAERIYRQILSRDPNHSVALHYLGVLAHQIGRNDDALPLLLRSIQLSPGNAIYYGNLGEVYRALRRFDEAEAALRQAIQLDPAGSHYHNNLGLTYLDQGRVADAREMLSLAIRLHPDDPKAHNNLGVALQSLGELEQAEQSLRRSIALSPTFISAYSNLASVLSSLDRPDEALGTLSAAMKLAPDSPDLHLVRSHVLLSAGHLAEGWQEYEWRVKGKPELQRKLPCPLWDGSDLHGRTILLYSEQGFGDAIQFIRYAPLVARRGGRVFVEALPALKSLLSSVSGVAEVIEPGQPTEHRLEVCCSLLGLPRLFGTELDTIPAEVPYLHADATKQRHWRERIDAASPRSAARLRVGLAWAGNPQHEQDRVRSCPLAALAPLADRSSVAFFSLQKNAAAAWETDAARAALRLIDLTQEMRDFADTAAAVMNLDLVIAVDTAAAHLAGALGKEVWTLLATVPEWRWMRHRSDSPWYPTMRLLRQSKPNDWNELASRVAAELDRRLEGACRDGAAGRATGAEGTANAS